MRQRKRRIVGPFRVRLKHVGHAAAPTPSENELAIESPASTLDNVAASSVFPQLALASVGLLGRCERSDEVFTLPDGVRSVAWDYTSRRLPRAHLSAVLIEDRLLILPIHESFLDSSYRQVKVDPTVWSFLGIDQGRFDS